MNLRKADCCLHCKFAYVYGWEEGIEVVCSKRTKETPPKEDTGRTILWYWDQGDAYVGTSQICDWFEKK